MYSIRRMNSSDIESVRIIENQSASAWSSSQVVAELDGDFGTLFCAVVPGEESCIGWCAVRTFADEAELLKIAVHIRHRKKGVGTALLQHLAEYLVQRCVSTLFLEVRSRNDSAIRFYLQNGFHKVGRRPNYYRDPEDDALLFRKQLDECDEPHRRRNI